MKPDGIVRKQAETRGKRPPGVLEVGASGRHEHYSRLSPGEEEGKETTQRRGGEDGESRKASEGEVYKY